MQAIFLLLATAVLQCSCQQQDDQQNQQQQAEQKPRPFRFNVFSPFGSQPNSDRPRNLNGVLRDVHQLFSSVSKNTNQQQQQENIDDVDLSGRIGLVGDDLNLRPVPGSPFDLQQEGRRVSRPRPRRPNSSSDLQLNDNSVRGTHHPDCYCTEYGRCPYSEGFDGSGLIDIRIVNRHPNHNPHDGSTNSGSLSCSGGQQPCCPPQQPNICPTAPVARTCGERTIIPVPGHKKKAGDAALGAYPGQSTIMRGDNEYVAAGGLIDPNWVVTVAHRVTQYVRRPSQLKVRLGEWNASDDAEPCPMQEREVRRIVVHRHFNPSNLHNDIALVQLAQPVDLQTAPHINSYCLPGRGERFDGARCWLAGFGKNAFGAPGNYSYLLQEVDLSVVPSARCQNQLRRTQLGPNFVLDRRSFVCAGGEAGKDACEGDGGAPLICLTDRGWTMAGLVAWGVGCARYNTPGVYTNVATYYNWIRRHTEYYG